MSFLRITETSAVQRDCMCGEKQLSPVPLGSDQHRTDCGTDARGTLKHSRTGDVSLIGGAAVFAKVKAVGGVCAVSVFERHQQRRHGRCATNACWATPKRGVFSRRGVASEAGGEDKYKQRVQGDVRVRDS